LKIEEIKRYRRAFYNNRAPVYDDLYWDGKESHPELNGFKKLAKIEEGNVVLDVATGTGNYLIEMAKQGALCYGIDISSKMLERLNLKIKQESLEEHVKDIRVGEADSLPYQNDFFNLVTCIGLFEYYPIEYSLKVLREITRARAKILLLKGSPLNPRKEMLKNSFSELH